MPITFNCPCGKALRVADENAGKRVKCPACQAVGSVPAAAPQFEVVEDEPPPKPAAPPAKAKPVAKVVVDEDDDEDERPKKKPKVVVDDDEPRAKKKPEFRKGARRRDDDDDDDDDEDERPKRKKKKGDPDAGKKILYLIGGLVLAVAGIAIAYWWYQDGPHLGRRPYSGYILGVCCVIVGLATSVKGITGNFDDDE